jgi:hypothetical protein
VIGLTGSMGRAARVRGFDRRSLEGRSTDGQVVWAEWRWTTSSGSAADRARRGIERQLIDTQHRGPQRAAAARRRAQSRPKLGQRERLASVVGKTA